MSDATEPRSRYPLAWRLLDWSEAVAAAVWPARFKRATPYLFLLPAFAIVFIIVLGLVYIGDASLRVLDPNTFRLSEDYTLENFREVAERTVYLRILWRSLLGAVIVTAVCVTLAFPYAYAMVRTASRAMRKLLLISLFLPFFLGQVVRAYGWLIILGKQGLINNTLNALGFADVSLIYTYPGVLIGLAQYMLPFAVLLLAPALTAIPEEMELASESLGATWPRTFWHVVLPMAQPGLIAASVVVFTLSITDFAMATILGGGTTDFIANAIYDGFFQTSDAGLGSALALLLVLLTSLMIAVLFTIFGTGTLGFVADRDETHQGRETG